VRGGEGHARRPFSEITGFKKQREQAGEQAYYLAWPYTEESIYGDIIRR